MEEAFVHPYTKIPLKTDSEGNLFCNDGNEGKSHLFLKKCDGCYDFSALNPTMEEARRVYDELYSHQEIRKLTLSEVKSQWFEVTIPWRQTMLKNLGDLSGKKILLLGNGNSYKEFFFYYLGAKLVFTDLSLEAVRRAKKVFRRSEFWSEKRDPIMFHAVDAMHLPFPNEYFDIIYGSKFVQFLDNLDDFFFEVSRCLKSGGMCRFSDDGYSPVWEMLKRAIVRPIKERHLAQSKAHLPSVRLDRVRSGCHIANVQPGFYFAMIEDSLWQITNKYQFKKFIFIREYFLLRIAQICWATMVGWSPERQKFAKPIYLLLKATDSQLSKISWMRRNQIALTWGFDK